MALSREAQQARPDRGSSLRWLQSAAAGCAAGGQRGSTKALGGARLLCLPAAGAGPRPGPLLRCHMHACTGIGSAPAACGHDACTPEAGCGAPCALAARGPSSRGAQHRSRPGSQACCESRVRIEAGCVCARRPSLVGSNAFRQRCQQPPADFFYEAAHDECQPADPQQGTTPPHPPPAHRTWPSQSCPAARHGTAPVRHGMAPVRHAHALMRRAADEERRHNRHSRHKKGTAWHSRQSMARDPSRLRHPQAGILPTHQRLGIAAAGGVAVLDARHLQHLLAGGRPTRRRRRRASSRKRSSAAGLQGAGMRAGRLSPARLASRLTPHAQYWQMMESVQYGTDLWTPQPDSTLGTSHCRQRMARHRKRKCKAGSGGAAKLQSGAHPPSWACEPPRCRRLQAGSQGGQGGHVLPPWQGKSRLLGSRRGRPAGVSRLQFPVLSLKRHPQRSSPTAERAKREKKRAAAQAAPRGAGMRRTLTEPQWPVT